jgi:polyhydroxyalkanoate synthesis regulator phasin
MAQRKGTRHGASTGGNAVADSAQKIWLAGLGAFERAKAEGPRMFDTLVEQGKTLGGKARVAADDALKAMRDGRFDKLQRQVSELTDDVRGLIRGQAGAGSAAKRAGSAKRGATAKRRTATKSASTGGRTGAKRRAAATAGAVKRKAGNAATKARRSVAQRTRKARSTRR